MPIEAIIMSICIAGPTGCQKASEAYYYSVGLNKETDLIVKKYERYYKDYGIEFGLANVIVNKKVTYEWRF